MKLIRLKNTLRGWHKSVVREKALMMVVGFMVMGAAAVGTPVSAADVVERFEAVAPIMGEGAEAICKNRNGNGESIPEAIKKASGCYDNDSAELVNVITSIINGVIEVMGFLAVIMIIVGGYKYMTAAGDASKLEAGRKTLLYACVGLIICALAFMIVNFVVKNVIGGKKPETTPSQTSMEVKEYAQPNLGIM